MKTEFDSLDKEPLIKRGVKFGFRLNSKVSQAFILGEDRLERRNFLYEAFDLSNKERFYKKYEEASTGSGNPYKDFDALRSSALCALLSFYNIKDLVIDGVHYDKAFFEVQNVVIEGETPSNMDVVLVSNNNKTILFLECKFSEYKSNELQKIPNAYLDNCPLAKKLYDLLQANELAKIDRKERKFDFYTKEAYSQGTKQVISHLVGITSFINKKEGYDNIFSFYSNEDTRKELYKESFDKIIFREVLFKLKGYERALNNYVTFSEKVRDLFVKSGLIGNIKFAPAATYQEIFSGDNLNNLDDLVREFYQYGNKD